MSWIGLVRLQGFNAFMLLLGILVWGVLPVNGQQQVIRLFEVDHQQELQWKALRSNRNVRILNYDAGQYQKLKDLKPASFNLLIPGLEGQDIEVELVENKVLNEDFVLSTDKVRNLAYNPGLYYSGRIKGQEHSIVVMSFFENEVMGMISPPGRSNLVIGNSPVLRRNSFVLFDDGQVDAPAFTCLSHELPDWTKDLNTLQGGFRQQQSAAGCVRVYFECGNSVLESKGSESGVANFVSSFYNAVTTIYSKEGISTNISEIKVWTTREPYGVTSDRGLEDFGAALAGNFNGDLAHFIRVKTGTFSGLAWLDVLCKTNRYAYSEVSANYTTYPTYSWTVNVIAHEMGHNLGSPHTQSCTWPGGAIDNCANPEGTCQPGPAPTNGGTIMSYCHQLTSIGVNFNNGFGNLPGNRIRDRVNGATCLTSCSGGGGVEVVTAPDLVINSLSADPGELSSTSTSSTISYTTSNTGNAASAASRSTAYLSTDISFSSNDQVLVNSNIGALSAGAGTSNTFSFNFSSGTNPGTYYIIVCADQGNAVNESSESNNCRSLAFALVENAPPPPPTPPNPVLVPDLALSISSTVPSLTAPGFSLILTGRITNLGPGKAVPTQLGVVLSVDALYSAEDRVLANTNTPAIDNQGIYDFNTAVTMPAGLPQENYQLIICADATKTISETDEINNCRTFSIRIHSDKADLIPKSLQVNTNPSPSGSPFSVLFTNFNQGALAAGTFWTGLYLSKNNKIRDADDLLLGQSITGDGLGSNQSKADQFSVSSLINPGSYTLLVCTDDRNQITEYDEANNCAAISMVITNPLPDLVIQQLVTPAEFYLGDTQNIRFIIYNNGFLKAGPFQVSLTISNKASSGSGSTTLATLTVPFLDINERIESAFRVGIHDLKWVGRPYLNLCSDAGLSIKESDETNNCRENQTSIKEPLPDLKLIAKSVASVPFARGSSFQLPLILTNAGKKPAPESESEIYITDKALIKTGNSLTVSVDTLEFINPGDTLRKNLKVQLPYQLGAGVYYLNICTDYDAKIKEESEINNCQSYKIQIRNLYSDVAVDSFRITESKIYSNLPFGLKLRLSNTGETGLSQIELGLFAATVQDTLELGFFTVDTLSTGQSLDSILAVHLPDSFKNKEVHFWVQADPSDKILEIREDNNYAEYNTMAFEPQADLIPVSISLEDSVVRSGGPFKVNLKILNQGLVASGPFQFSIRLVDTIADKLHPDTLEVITPDPLSLAPGQTDSTWLIIDLPQSKLSGSYPIIGMADPLKEINESEESNNSINFTIPVLQRLPDVLAVDLAIPESLSRYTTLSGALQIANAGDWDMPALTDTVYLSPDSVYSKGDIPAGLFQSDRMSPGQIQFVPFQWSITDQVSSGTQFLLLTLDAQGQYPEHLKTNNSLVVRISVPTKKADLNLVGLQLARSTIFPGDTLTITNYIENIGETRAGSFELVQFLKKHPSDTSYIYRFPPSRLASGLQPGESKELSSKVLLPDSVYTNTYYLISCLDRAGEIDELRKDNNCGQLIITVHAKQGISTGLKKDPLFSGLQAYPNPVTRDLHIEGTLAQPRHHMDVYIRDYTGRVLLHYRLGSGTAFNFQADLSQIPSGWYYFDLHSSGGSWKQPFLKL